MPDVSMNVARPQSRMNRNSAFLLQAAIVLVGIAALAFLLWEPHIEGRNAHATVFEIYFEDPFLAYVYVGSIPLFIALHRAFRLASHVRENGALSQVAVDALHVIAHCMMALFGFATGGLAFVIMFGDGDDRPAGIFMGFLVALPSIVVAIAAAAYARKLQDALGEAGGRLRQ